ncbi:MAG: DUF6293 family protein [Halapricum sp.]
MEQIEEIHIAPLGYEYDRIVDPIRKHNADVAYLLEDTVRGEHVSYHDEMIDELRTDGVTVRIESVDLQDLYDVMAVVTTIAAEHDDDIVRVNVASGPKIAGIGSAIACMATEATPYYVRPEAHVHPLDEKPLTEGMVDDEKLPSYPIEAISRDQVAVLDFLAETNTESYTAKKKDLIEFAEDAELEFMTEASPANDKAKFALLNANVVDPLAEDGYIEVMPVGRQKQLALTETGENVLHAFRHKL